MTPTPNHLKAVHDGPVFHIQGTRAELLQLKSALAVICDEAEDMDYERTGTIGEAIKGQIIGVWEIDAAAPKGYLAEALEAQ